jgi:ABC-type tungstate transport system substrate-binding protein
VPPIAIYLTGFQWMKMIGYSSDMGLDLVWILGHVVLCVPLLTAFVAVTHFRTTNAELNYLESQRVSALKIGIDSFFRRYRIEYIFTFLVSFSLIWNEPIVNNLLSDFIPSFVSEMKMNIEGRGADYGKGINYMIISILIATISLLLWQLSLKKIHTENDFSNL